MGGGGTSPASNASLLRAHHSLGSTKSHLSISEYLWCDVSLASLNSWRGKPLHPGSSHSVHIAPRHWQYYGRNTPVAHRNWYAGMHRKGGGDTPHPLQGAQPMPSRFPPTASAGFNGICNRQ